jgi:beta-xylosidase
MHVINFKNQMKKEFLTVFILTITSLIFAQNPIVPAGIYLADPSAHVWNNGKLYLYVSVDESTEYYCSYKHHVLSTSDMINWEIAENVFSSRGENDEISYSDKLLFAPDCAFKDGIYYLYYCQPDNQAAEGVATSDSPLGPFVNGKKIELNGIEEIDPSVFIDDDGQEYYMWGQFTAKIAKLKSNMTEIDTSIIITDLVNEKEHFFQEGGFMTKRNGIYYFLYAGMSRGNRPTAIGYATSHSPLGPFKYGGVIIDNTYCDPISWNNHGSIAEFNGQWYVFYHRATHSSHMMRKACVEPIYFNEDGSINEVEMTSQGAGPALDAFLKIEAERACLLYGNTRIEEFEKGKEELAKIQNDDNAAYKYIDFKDGATAVEFRIKQLKAGGAVSIHIDQPWGKHIAWINIEEDKIGEWQTIKAEINETKGKHAVWLKFHGKQEDIFELDWFRFN